MEPGLKAVDLDFDFGAILVILKFIPTIPILHIIENLIFESQELLSVQEVIPMILFSIYF